MLGDPGRGVNLEGRPFIYGAFDCYSVVKDFCSREMEFDLPEITRPRFGWWTNWEVDPFTDGAESCGMVDVSSPEYGDILLFKDRNYKSVNHIGVYVGGNRFLHHRVFSLSSTSNYDESYRNATVRILRRAN